MKDFWVLMLIGGIITYLIDKFAPESGGVSKWQTRKQAEEKYQRYRIKRKQR